MAIRNATQAGPATIQRISTVMGVPGKDGLPGAPGAPGPGFIGLNTATVTGGVVNHNIPTNGLARVNLVGAGSDYAIGGFAPGNTPWAAGNRIAVSNLSAYRATVVNEDTGSAVNNRISNAFSLPIVVPPYRTIELTYDGSRFEVSHAGFRFAANIFDVVNDFGADPTGVADSLAAFQRAVAAKDANKGGTIILPCGLYKLSAAWNTGTYACVIQGDRAQTANGSPFGDASWPTALTGSVLYFPNSGDGVVISSAVMSGSLFKDFGVIGPGVTGGGAAGASHGVTCTAASSTVALTLSGLLVCNWEQGINPGSFEDSTIQHTWIRGCQKGIVLDASITNAPTDWHFKDVKIESCTDAIIVDNLNGLDWSGGVIQGNVRGTTLRNCVNVAIQRVHHEGQTSGTDLTIDGAHGAIEELLVIGGHMVSTGANPVVNFVNNVSSINFPCFLNCKVPRGFALPDAVTNGFFVNINGAVTKSANSEAVIVNNSPSTPGHIGILTSQLNLGVNGELTHVTGTVIPGSNPSFQYPRGYLVENPSASSATNREWVNTRTGWSGNVWAPSTTIATGTINVASPDNGHAFQAQSPGGVTGGIQPAWNTGSGATTTDGTVTWKEIGTSALWLAADPVDGGDFSVANGQVTGIRSVHVPALGSGYLHYNGSAFVWDTPTTSSVTMGGDVTGPSSACTVAAFDNKLLSGPGTTKSQIYCYDPGEGAGQWDPVLLSGDLLAGGGVGSYLLQSITGNSGLCSVTAADLKLNYSTSRLSSVNNAGSGTLPLLTTGNFGGSADSIELGDNSAVNNIQIAAHGAVFALVGGVIPWEATSTALFPGAGNISLGINSLPWANLHVVQIAGDATGGTPVGFSSSTIALSGTSVTLNASQIASPNLILTGTLTSNLAITFPNAQGTWFINIRSLTLGEFGIALVSGSDSVSLPTIPGRTLYTVSTTGANVIAVG